VSSCSYLKAREILQGILLFGLDDFAFASQQDNPWALVERSFPPGAAVLVEGVEVSGIAVS